MLGAKTKKRILIMLSIVLSCIVILCVVIILFINRFADTNSAHYHFNEDFIIGNTLENIIDKYGEPYEEYSEQFGYISYFVGYSYLSDAVYYNIYFEDGIATYVDKTCAVTPYPGG